MGGDSGEFGALTVTDAPHSPMVVRLLLNRFLSMSALVRMGKSSCSFFMGLSLRSIWTAVSATDVAI